MALSIKECMQTFSIPPNQIWFIEFSLLFVSIAAAFFHTKKHKIIALLDKTLSFMDNSL